MAWANARDSKIMYSATLGGTYTCIDGVLTWNNQETGTDGQNQYVLCDAAPIVQTGTDDSTIELTGLRDTSSTTQTAIKAARDAGTAIYLQVLEDGTKGWKQPMKITRFNSNADANGSGLGKYTQWTATAVSAGARVAVP